MSRGACLALALLLAACSKSSSSDSAPTATATASAAAPVLDVEGFCEKAMGVGRPCEGDDELMEGNKIGLCATTLRAARDDEGVTLDPKQGKACLADVKAADPPLPDVRTLTTLAQRFDSCRTFTRQVPSLAKVEAVTLGAAAEGEACKLQSDCAHGLFCGDVGTCASQKKAGESCKSGQECVGRCSRKDGMKCVPYCGAG